MIKKIIQAIKEFFSPAASVNKHWDNIAEMIERDYDQKVKFEKFKDSDFITFSKKKHKNKDGSLDKRFKENR